MERSRKEERMTKRNGRVKGFSLMTGAIIMATAMAGWCSGAEPNATILKPEDAILWVNGTQKQTRIYVPNHFGPGTNSVMLWTVSREVFSQLRWTLTGLPEGEYELALRIFGSGYFCFGDGLYQQASLYHNDRRVVWADHTEPCRPENIMEKRAYQADLLSGRVLRLKSGDVIRLEIDPWASNITVGPLRLIPAAPGTALFPERTAPLKWLQAGLGRTETNGNEVVQEAWFFSSGAWPRSFTVQATATGYERTRLLDTQETITLAPGERQSRTYRFPYASDGRTTFHLLLSTPDVRPMDLVRVFVRDVQEGARPRSSLSGEWECAYVPGAEPGKVPPADLRWEPIQIPNVLSPEKGHCAWFRKQFPVPPYVKGERIVLKFGQVLCESWCYLNGKPVGYQRRGSEPFEIDITEACKPEGTNELLLACRSWIAYSPVNQQRVASGGKAIFKDAMLEPAGYTANAQLGVTRPVWLEARPSVAVQDVEVVTSIREGKLELAYVLVNKGSAARRVTISPVILDAGRTVMELPGKTVDLLAGGTVAVSFEKPWADAVRWTLGQPHLYVLRTEVKPDQGAADRHLQRFGFRELWIDGARFVLNGTPVKLRSAWTSGGNFPPLDGTPAERLENLYRGQLKSLHQNDVELMRTHNCIGVDEVCDMADETGVLLKIENGDFCQQNFTLDEGYWRAAVASESRMVDVYRNHPSVVMWSAGNENMWGWPHEQRVSGSPANQRQMEVCRVMRQHDAMKRPIEWEADGDLLGGWEHYSLHYPRELYGTPDLPPGAWWGPLDGTSTVPYCLGQITLGPKPLTVGEAFWARFMNPPFGGTLVLGDDAYRGANWQARGWHDSSKYFSNGFRDAEFALIDSFLPLSSLPPQTIVLKEETAAFYGGRTVVRQVNVHNDTRQAARLRLSWILVSKDRQKTFASGAETLSLQPAELKRVALRVRLPSQAAPETAEFKVQLHEAKRGTLGRLFGLGDTGEDKLVREEVRVWKLSPDLAIKMPEGLRLQVFDPVGETSARLRELAIPFTLLDKLLIPKEKGVLMIGADSLAAAAGERWREELPAFIRSGGRLWIFNQKKGFDLLPFPVTCLEKNRSTLAYVRSAGHPLMNGLMNEDLRWWADDHYVSEGNLRKPAAGNFLPIVDVGSMDGTVETPLMEQFIGEGSIILCQMPLLEKARSAPAAGRIVQNMLAYLAQSLNCRRMRKTAVFAGSNETLKKALKESGLRLENQDTDAGTLDVSTYGAAIVDAASAFTEQNAAWLKTFAENGGKVLLHKAAPGQGALLEKTLGLKLRFFPMKDEPNDIQNRVLLRAASDITAGLSNHELFWPGKKFLGELRGEGRFWSDCGPRPPDEYIADYFCQPVDKDVAKALRLTSPCALLQVPVGAGCFVISQLRLDEPIQETQTTVARLRAILLTNLGCALESIRHVGKVREERVTRYEFHHVFLDKFANRGLRDDPAKGIVGWSNQGENDMRNLPAGYRTFARVGFFISSPKAAITLYSVNAGNQGLPKEVLGIPVKRQADALFFLHAMAWWGADVFKYRVNYADKTSVDIPIRGEQQVLDWFTNPTSWEDELARHNTVAGWTGSNGVNQNVTVYCYEWTNPHPEKEIQTLDFLTEPKSGYAPVPILVGLTAATLHANDGIVEDVIGTRGIRVRTGNRTIEVAYIGLTGLPKGHGFYAEAVAKHKAMVVGKKVSLLDDALTKNKDGQRLCYVHFGTDTSKMETLVNAMLISEGLSDAGDYEANNRQRAYFENLKFIAEQSKRGLWKNE
jgi:hypothetical protein